MDLGLEESGVPLSSALPQRWSLGRYFTSQTQFSHLLERRRECPFAGLPEG